MTVLVTDVLGNKYVGIGIGVLTLLVLIFGEITPKTSADRFYSETLSLKFAKTDLFDHAGPDPADRGR